jgi:hypothetical protein
VSQNLEVSSNPHLAFEGSNLGIIAKVTQMKSFQKLLQAAAENTEVSTYGMQQGASLDQLKRWFSVGLLIRVFRWSRGNDYSYQAWKDHKSKKKKRQGYLTC